MFGVCVFCVLCLNWLPLVCELLCGAVWFACVVVSVGMLCFCVLLYGLCVLFVIDCVMAYALFCVMRVCVLVCVFG